MKKMEVFVSYRQTLRLIITDIPDIAILNADIANGEIPNNSVRYSIRIDSNDKINANKKTIHDCLINSN